MAKLPELEEIPNVGIFEKKNIMRRNTSVLLGDHFEKFISEEVSSGKYSSASEVIRTALRLLEEEEHKKQYLNDALKEGEKSGFVENFDHAAYLKKLNERI